MNPKATALLNRFTPAEVAERCVAAEEYNKALGNDHDLRMMRIEDQQNKMSKLEMRVIELEAEMAGMKLMEAEGDSFAETIVRQNEALEAENARLRDRLSLLCNCRNEGKPCGACKALKEANDDNR